MTTASPHPEANGVDPGISISTALLISMGVVMSYSATAALALDTKVPPLFSDHLIGLAIGLAAAAGAYAMSALAWSPYVARTGCPSFRAGPVRVCRVAHSRKMERWSSSALE